MPAALGKKGFYVSSPMLGAMIFLIAALIAVTLTTENDARIEITRSSEVQSKLQFISEAIMADSYDVLLQTNLEYLTKGFLEDEYFDINTNEPWTVGIKNNIEGHYVENLGESLGMDLETYSKAYGTMPGIDDCHIEQVGEFISWPTVSDSDQGDGTIMVKAASFGERIVCESRDPVGKVTVDIRGRPYRINVRIPNLYDAAKQILSLAKGAMNAGVTGIEEPIADWTGAKWYMIKKTDNTLLSGEADLDKIIDDWDTLMSWLSSRIISVSNANFKDQGLVGISLEEFKVVDDDEKGYELSDFDISCVEDGVGQYRNCIPFRTQIIMGNSECAYGEVPEDSDNPFYSLKSMSLKCDSGNCPSDMRSVMNELVVPMGSVCVEYYGASDSVYPVCKKWNAKAKSVIYQGELKDDDQMYVVAGMNETGFRFMDQQANVVVNSVKDNRLKCDEGDDDGERYKDNVRRLLEKIQLNIGSETDAGSTIFRWRDRGSVIMGLDDPYMKDIYKNIKDEGSEESLLPQVCFMEGVTGRSECYTQAAQSKPRIEITLKWEEAKENCINRIGDICNGYCGGIPKPEYTGTFCEGLFPEPTSVPRATGTGEMHCVCNGIERATEVRIASMTFAF